MNDIAPVPAGATSADDPFAPANNAAPLVLDMSNIQNPDDTIMKRTEILIAHEEFCKIWQASDGRWKTKIPDATKKGGYRLIAKSSKENLENAIIEHYRALEAEKKKDSTTLATLYPLWKEQQVNKGRSSRTIRRYDDMWKKYFENESIVSRDITKLTVAELENFINKLSSCKKGCRKSYQNQKWDS